MSVERKYSLVVIALTCFLGLSASLVIGELFLRLFYPQTLGVWGQTREGFTILRPMNEVRLEKFGTNVRTNSYGFRDREHDLGKSDGTVRILLMGDSFMEALQVDFAEAFPSILERELSARLGKCKVEVINAGVSGWGTDDEVAYLLQKGKEFRPDIVLFAVTIHNDISDNLEERHHILEEGQLIAKPVYEQSWYRFVIIEARSYLASHSHLYQIVYQSWKAWGRAEAGSRLRRHVIELMRHDQNPEVKRGWFITQKLLEKARDLASKNGFKLTMFIIPTIYQVDTESFSNLIAAHQLSDSELDRDKPIEEMLSLLEKEEILTINLLPDFRSHQGKLLGQQLYIPDDGHFSKEGHKLAASVVSRYLFGKINEWDTESRCWGLPSDPSPISPSRHVQ